MNIREQVYKILSASTDYTTYGRVAAPDATTPYVVFSVVSDVPGHTHAGHDTTSDTRIQVSCYSTSYEVAGTTAEAVYEAMINSTDSYGIKITRKVNELDIYEKDTKLHHIPVDFILSWIAT